MSISLGPGAEFDRIRAIAATLGARARGLGDDCALVELGAGTVALSVDASVDGVHFRRDWLAPREIGWRAAAGALSDLAAAGASARGVLVAITLPRDDPAELPAELMAGVGAVADSVGAAVWGGDLTAGPVLSLAVTVVGEASRPLRRGGASPGDRLWVSGTLGGARAALLAWLDGRDPDPGARARFARPEPRTGLGQWAAAAGATAAIDLSDGLAGDAGHLAAASGVRLVVELDRLPVGPGVAREAASAGEPPPTLAARGGEDYELLFTLPAEVEPTGAPVPLTAIGRVERGEGVRLVLEGTDVTLQSFDHFR
ncbi:MAG: thiamine-phosphate kinase [Gemmatimonadales bacterium]